MFLFRAGNQQGDGEKINEESHAGNLVKDTFMTVSANRLFNLMRTVSVSVTLML